MLLMRIIFPHALTTKRSCSQLLKIKTKCGWWWNSSCGETFKKTKKKQWNLWKTTVLFLSLIKSFCCLNETKTKSLFWRETACYKRKMYISCEQRSLFWNACNKPKLTRPALTLEGYLKRHNLKRRTTDQASVGLFCLLWILSITFYWKHSP